MSARLRSHLRNFLWRAAGILHGLDYAIVLPAIARLPLPLGYALGRLRGRINAAFGRDWRSMALGFRHIRRQTLAGLRLIDPQAPEEMLKAWRRERYETEAGDEFEAALIAAGRVPALACEFVPPGAATLCRRSGRGLVLLTPHFDSFFIGIGFLARSGGCVNVMTSAVTHDPRVHKAVQGHFERKYRGLEAYLNGGRLLDIEDGARPFYQMLKRGETVVILADASAAPGSEPLETDFLGRRMVAGGALRMAQQTGSDLGGFVCRRLRDGYYRLEAGPVAPAAETADGVYRFLGEAIRSAPGRWWAADLLPAMLPAMPAAAPADLDVLMADAGPLAHTDELALGLRQLRRRIPSGRWWHGGPDGLLPSPADFLAYSRAAAVLVILEPALIVSDNLVAELWQVCEEFAAGCALPADPRVAAGAFAVDYASRPGFDRYVARRGTLDAGIAYDGRMPWLYLIRRAALRAAVADAPATGWAELPRSPQARALTAQRAFVHGYGDYQRHGREEMLDLLPADVANLLDVGGGEGGFAAAFVRGGAGRRAIVAEPNPAAADAAAARGLDVHAGPFETFADRLRFDCVSFLDVLEHLADPAAALRRARALLRPGGYLLLAVPNVGHWSVVGDLLDGDFHYLPVGILCETHIRFFARHSLEDLLDEAGFEIVHWRNHASPPPAAFFERLAAAGNANRESLATDSFHVLARKS